MLLNMVKGVRVPEFFCVTTSAFRKAIRNQIPFQRLDARCKVWLSEPSDNNRQKLFALAAQIRDRIEHLSLPTATRTEIKDAMKKLNWNSTPVACRSSATTEDTADASFAGQHDTFLNQIGFNNVLKSILKCWSSAFTDRAIEYRLRQNINHREAVMCVVVQKMVEPDGRCFTFGPNAYAIICMS